MAKKSSKTRPRSAKPTDAATSAPEPETDKAGKKALTIMVSPVVYRQLRLLASAEGKTLSRILLDPIEKELADRLAAAIDDIKAGK